MFGNVEGLVAGGGTVVGVAGGDGVPARLAGCIDRGDSGAVEVGNESIIVSDS